MGQFFALLNKQSQWILATLMIAMILVLLTPIPTALLDVLLIINISFALIIFLLSLQIENPLKFTTFPSLLLITTLFRLVLNISATRLILSSGYAGQIIKSIGDYVVAGNTVIGLVIFLILIVVQFVVITSGAGRVAEVAARFVLDSMPGKQMSIDADLNIGLIDKEEAKARRKEIEQSANFYGAMDGASKFVKGDAVAGIVIILINIIGGLSIGLMQMGMSLGEAFVHFTLLTVGDGIVTQIPALIISIATGIIITRASTDSDLSSEINSQILSAPKILLLVCAALSVMLFVPGTPKLTILLMVSLIGAVYYCLNRYKDSEEYSEQQLSIEEKMQEELALSLIEIRLGSVLSQSVADNKRFQGRLKVMQRNFAFEFGYIYPDVNLKLNSLDNEQGYEVVVKGAVVASGSIYPDSYLVINPSEESHGLSGHEVLDPTFKLPAIWIGADELEKAKSKNLTAIDAETVLLTHFNEAVKLRAHSLFTRDVLEHYLKPIKERQNNLLQELVPNKISLSVLQKVLQELLVERVSIRDVSTIVESLNEICEQSKDISAMTEYVRGALSESISQPYLDTSSTLNILALSQKAEHELLNQSEQFSPEKRNRLIGDVAQAVGKMMAENLQPVLLCAPTLRRLIKRWTQATVPNLAVISFTEVPGNCQVKSYAIVGDENE